jgi:hypothetical protein
MSSDRGNNSGPLRHVIGSKGKVNNVLRDWINKAIKRRRDRGAPGEQR